MTPAAAPAAHRSSAARIALVSASPREARAPRTLWALASIGHLVPRSPWLGRVHSVFARACNVAVGDALLSVVAPGIDDAPTTLVLAGDAAPDLRDRFVVGERVDCRGARIRGERVELDFATASVWRPAERTAPVASARIAARVRAADAQLERQRATHASVLEREAAPHVAALARACAALDVARAVAHADRLIGWGEGLTPAGDDFLVGLVAGLDALACDDRARRSFRAALAAAIAAGTERTTPIAAHALRLALGGHLAASLDRLVAAICCASDDRAVDAALARLLAVGATSGADTASGALVALHAWRAHPGGAAS